MFFFLLCSMLCWHLENIQESASLIQLRQTNYQGKKVPISMKIYNNILLDCAANLCWPHFILDWKTPACKKSQMTNSLCFSSCTDSVSLTNCQNPQSKSPFKLQIFPVANNFCSGNQGHKFPRQVDVWEMIAYSRQIS